MKPFEFSCAQVSREKLIARVAAYLARRRREERENAPGSPPGVCQVCGHPLPVAYRVCDLGTRPTRFVEVPAGTPDAKRCAELVANPEQNTDGLMILQVHACECAADPEIYAEARKRRVDDDKPAAPARPASAQEELF
jgi:hypothetical protein